MTPPGVATGIAPAALARLKAELDRLGRVVVAFSGGVDSTLLAVAATRTLGAEHALCATAVSPSLPDVEREACRELAADWGLRHQEVETEELGNPAYVANGADRCFHCKSALMDALGPLAAAERATVVLGVQADDFGGDRPGQEAARERGARFPLADAGMGKADVRAAAAELGIAIHDKPAAACLASRIPTGTPVTGGRLAQVGAAEAALHGLGFRVVRVRHHGEIARVELDEEGLARLASVGTRRAVANAVRAAGYKYASVDLDGYRPAGGPR